MIFGNLFNNRFSRPRPFGALSDTLSTLTRGRLWAKVLLGLFLGIAVGILLGPGLALIRPSIAAVIGNWLALPGQLFLTLIQMIVIPLVFASVIRGLAASDNLEQLKRMGTRAVLYFIVTTAVAILIGMSVGLLIRPGSYIDSELLQSALGSTPVTVTQNEITQPELGELPGTLINLFPTNPLNSMVEGQMLQIILFAGIFGVALVMMRPSRSRPLLELMASLQEVCMTVVGWAMRLAPYAVFGLMAQIVSRIGFEALLGMAVYVGTVLLGLLAMVVLYLLLISLFGQHSPWRFLRSVREVLLLAFSTSSSAAVMPLSIKTAEEKLSVRPSIAQFVIPLGATINMNGTALYQGVAAIFLAQVFGIDIGISGMLLITVTAVGAAIGSPATPGVGIVILAMVLDSVGIPAAGIALIMGVDRILDMSRTAVNVAGDLTACILMDRWIEQPEPATEPKPLPVTGES